MKNWNASQAMFETNNAKLVELIKYETDHHNDLPAGPIYWAVVHEIESLEKQNKELSDWPEMVK